jgi:hypothetical protein
MMPRHPPRALSSLTYIKAHAQLKYHLPVVQDRRYPVRLLRCCGRPRRLRPERPTSCREGFVGGGHPPSLLAQNIGLMFKPMLRLRHQCEGEAIQLRALFPSCTPVSAESCFSVPSAAIFGKPPGHPPNWWSRGDSNPRPPPCKGGALPTKLRPHALSAKAWWAILDSNQGPQSYQDCALTT